MDELTTTGETPSGAAWDSQLEPVADRPYHTKRPHKKSRSGCKNCKTRKVKCDEARPVCKHCQLRKEVCMYPSPAAAKPPSSSASSPPPEVSSGSGSERQSPSRHDSQLQAYLQPAGLDQYSLSERGAVLLQEPLFVHHNADAFDMQLLWLYCTTTYGSFSTNSGKLPMIDDILKVKIVQYAFEKPFLMDAILGLAALHLKHLDTGGNVSMEIPQTKALAYRARAFEGYRKAVETGHPEDYAPVLAGSLILCALSSETLRDPNYKPLYIVDWMIVWRGIGLIVNLISPDAMFNSGLAPLFFRPPIDLDASAMHIPNNLLFMVTSIKEGDFDYPYVAEYYEALKYLGSLYRELTDGFSAILDLRIIVWFTFLPKHFIEMARQYRPRALVILAYYLVFAKLVTKVWWMKDISNNQLKNIQDYLDSDWGALLQVPMKSIELEEKGKIAKLLLGNHAWEPEQKEKETRTLAMVDDLGKEVFYLGRFQYKAPSRSVPMWNHLSPGLQLADERNPSEQGSPSGDGFQCP